MERVQRIKYLFAFAAGVGCLLAAFQVKAQTSTYPLSPAQVASLDNDFQAMMRRVGNNDVTIRPDGKIWVRDIAKPVRMPSGATVGVSAGTELAKKAVAAGAAAGVLRLGAKALPYVGLSLTAYDVYQMLNGKNGFLVDQETGQVTGLPHHMSQDGYVWVMGVKLPNGKYEYETGSPLDTCMSYLASRGLTSKFISLTSDNASTCRCNHRNEANNVVNATIQRISRAGYVVPRVLQTQEQLYTYINNNLPLLNTDAVKNAVRDGVLEALKDKNDFSNLPDVVVLPDGTKLQPNTKTKVDTKVETKTIDRNGVKERITTTTETSAELGPDGKVKFTTDTTEVVQPLGEAGQPTGSPTSTTTTSAPAPDKEPPGLCDLFPDILACKKLDEVSDEPVKKETKTITLQEADLGFGGGKCPDNVVSTINGKTLTIIDMQQSCGIVSSYVKPLILLLSSFISMMIIFAGITKTEL